VRFGVFFSQIPESGQTPKCENHSKPLAMRFRMALICMGITIETAMNHVNYDITHPANPYPCASRQASLDRK